MAPAKKGQSKDERSSLCSDFYFCFCFKYQLPCMYSSPSSLFCRDNHSCQTGLQNRHNYRFHQRWIRGADRRTCKGRRSQRGAARLHKLGDPTTTAEKNKTQDRKISAPTHIWVAKTFGKSAATDSHKEVLNLNPSTSNSFNPAIDQRLSEDMEVLVHNNLQEHQRISKLLVLKEGLVVMTSKPKICDFMEEEVVDLILDSRAPNIKTNQIGYDSEFCLDYNSTDRVDSGIKASDLSLISRPEFYCGSQNNDCRSPEDLTIENLSLARQHDVEDLQVPPISNLSILLKQAQDSKREVDSHALSMAYGVMRKKLQLVGVTAMLLACKYEEVFVPGRLKEAVELFEEMVSKVQVMPDALTYNVLVNGFCREGKVDQARKIMDFMRKNGCCPNIFIYSALMNRFCKEGRVEEAILMRKSGMKVDVVGYTTLINYLCRFLLRSKLAMYSFACRLIFASFIASY
ncbi:hypothetical protein HHK36_009294 [Tetracentron sinense]|uniref:Cyclin N-terminal domain-containing protein n=1 Tax=Tetracentron sinense TaxID=13715 RepID=A0A834ZAM5_TETSI|nr:hypothetical protein HHK36_009294 [Tetracentron sinense]